MIGIIGAMEEEVVQLKAELLMPVVTQIAGMDFIKGILLKKEVIIVRSGIGKVNAALCTQILIDHFRVDVIINTGIAGSLKNDIEIGDIVLSTDAIQHDVDATYFGYKRGEIPRMNRRGFPTDDNLRELAYDTCLKVNPDIGVHVGCILSGDQFIAGIDKKKDLIESFNGSCTEMEGAAIAQVAYLNNVACLIIRAISDKADDSACVDYPTFEKEAICHCVKLTKELVCSIS